MVHHRDKRKTYVHPCGGECINTGLDWTGLGNLGNLSTGVKTLEDMPLHNAHSDCPCKFIAFSILALIPDKAYAHVQRERLVHKWRGNECKDRENEAINLQR